MNESTALYKSIGSVCFPGTSSSLVKSEELISCLRLDLDQCSLLCEILQSSLDKRDKRDKDVDARQIAALLDKFRHHRAAQVATLWCCVVRWFCCAPGGDDVDTTNLGLLSSMVSFEDMMRFEEMSEDGGGIMGQAFDGAEKWAMEQLTSALSHSSTENKCDRPSASALAIMIEMVSRDLSGADCRKIVSLVCANFSVAEIREIIKELGKFSLSNSDLLLGPDTNKSMIGALEAMIGFWE